MGEQTPELMVTGRSCMKVNMRLKEPRSLKQRGRRNMPNGPSGPRPVCPSGLVRGLARRLEILRPQRVEMKLLRKRRKSKSWSPIPEILIHRYLVLIGCLVITSKRTFQLSSHYHNIVLILVLKL